MKSAILFMLIFLPNLVFGQIICPDYKATLSVYCSSNDCTEMISLEAGFAKTGMSLMSLPANCQAQAYKNMVEVLVERLAIEKEQKDEALALAEKRKKTNTILGITTGVAAAGAIGLGVAYGKQKKENKDLKADTKVVKGDSKVCTEDQIRAIAKAGQVHYAKQLVLYFKTQLKTNEFVDANGILPIHQSVKTVFEKDLGDAASSSCSISF